MREVPLTKGKVAIVDDEDYEKVASLKWYAQHNTNTWYAMLARDRNLSMHQLILGKQPKGLMVDHRDGDGLNNTRANLRPVTNSQNIQNSRLQRRSVSGYKGVHWKKRDKRWESRLVLHKKVHYLGYFTDPVEAALAYDSKAKELYGEFARLNFPDERREGNG